MPDSAKLLVFNGMSCIITPPAEAHVEPNAASSRQQPIAVGELAEGQTGSGPGGPSKSKPTWRIT
jgi:hypothetical protein